MAFEGVIGRTLTGLAVSKDGETTLRLSFAEGDHHYVTTHGDCCSESWWADILGVGSWTYGKKILDILPISLPDSNDRRTRQEIDALYGYAIKMEMGVITLIFRNSSNGYYGGWSSDTDTPPECEWVEIREDWSA